MLERVMRLKLRRTMAMPPPPRSLSRRLLAALELGATGAWKRSCLGSEVRAYSARLAASPSSRLSGSQRCTLCSHTAIVLLPPHVTCGREGGQGVG